MIDETYLPYSPTQLRSHFAPVAGDVREDPERHVAYYVANAGRLSDYVRGVSSDSEKRARQIERDERFWVASALLGLYYSEDRQAAFSSALVRALGANPPVTEFNTWEQSLAGPLRLYFEVGLPSPHDYRVWLREHVQERALVPYAREAGARSRRLEGRTQVDAVLVAPETGFAVLFEAKVLSDVDTKITYDVMRNQIARNIDVMLEPNPELEGELSRRRPDRSCFVLLTPGVFKENFHSRLYGFLMREYRDNPALLGEHLAHRRSEDWSEVVSRLGWLTYEDCEEIRPGACRWLSRHPTT